MSARDDLAAVMNGHPHFLDGRSMQRSEWLLAYGDDVLALFDAAEGLRGGAVGVGDRVNVNRVAYHAVVDTAATLFRLTGGHDE